MVKALGLVWLFGIGLAVSSCTSYVKTYDGGGNMIGACKTGVTLFGAPFFPAGRGRCGGSANPKEQGK